MDPREYTAYFNYMMTRFLGRSLVGPGMFSERGLAFVRGLGLVWVALGLGCVIGMPTMGFWTLLLFDLFLACDALHAGILALHNHAWNRAAKRDFDKNILVLANAMPYTLQGDSGTAILFIHGFGDTPETWQLVAPRVHSLANATCRAMRLPFAATTLRRQHHAHLGDWLAAIRDEAADLRRCHEKVFIAGQGMGAGLALLAACEDPKLADGVVVFSPVVRAKRASKILFWLADHFCVFTRVVPNPCRGVIRTQDGRAYSYARDPFVAFAAFRAFFQMTRRLVAAQARSAAGLRRRLPVLAFVSSRDRLVDIPAAMRFLDGADILDGADVYTSRKAGHALTLDVDWEKRAARTAAFAPPYFFLTRTSRM